MLLVAAGAQAAVALLLVVAAVTNAVEVATGQSYQRSSGIGLTVLEFIVVAGLAWIASGLAQARPWTRTPSAIAQGFTLIMAVILLQAHRYDWGVIALLLAIAGLAGLFTPASFRALARPEPDDEPAKTPADKTSVNRRS
jgi:hypothetical protein